MEYLDLDSATTDQMASHARESVLQALREQSPEDSSLDDDALIVKYAGQSAIDDLIAYFVDIQRDHKKLDKDLIEAGGIA